MRINARLDDERAAKIEFLRRMRGTNTSEVLKAAIDAFYEKFRSEELNGNQRLLNSGFVGMAAGDPDLSTNYKSELSKALEAKHDHR
ncbi:MAG: ribbon-helix-helix domain-containing protein [Gammaproteobacteria bacterium]